MARKLEENLRSSFPGRLLLIGFWCVTCFVFQVSNKTLYAGTPDVHPFLLAEDTHKLPSDPELQIFEDKNIVSDLESRQIEILIRDQVELSKDRVVLEDVAVCTGARRICRELGSIDLGVAPSPGRTMRFTKTGINELLVREWPGNKFKVIGPEIVKVTAQAIEVDRSALQRNLTSALEELSTAGEGIRVKLERMQVIAPSKVRPGVARYEFPDLTNMPADTLSRITRNNSGAISIEVELYDSMGTSESVQRITLSAQLIVERLIVVAANDLNAGDTLKESDLKLEWVAFRTQGQRGFTVIESLIGLRVKRSMNLGRPIEGAAVESPALVSRGELVGFKFRAGDLEINAKVEALGSGSSGDVIDVLNKDTKKKLRAKIVARSQVEAF